MTGRGRLRLGHADDGHFWIREDDSWDHPVIQCLHRSDP